MNHFTKKKFIERFLDMIIILIFSPRNLLCFEKKLCCCFGMLSLQAIFARKCRAKKAKKN